MELSPSPNITKLGSLLVIFVIAVLAVWAANNLTFLTNLTAKKVKTA
jgi:hypothetical protein